MTQTLIEFLSRHLLALSGTYVVPDQSERKQFAEIGVPPSAKRIHFVYSAVPVVYNNDWYVLTAGHAILPYMTAIQKQEIFSTGCAIVDTAGKANKCIPAIPYEIRDYFEYAIDASEIGLDYALLKLSKNHLDLMNACGNEIVPLPLEPNIPKSNPDDAFHIALGLPSERTILESVNPGHINYLYTQPWTVPIERIEDDACEYPRFVGRILNLDNLESMVGVSGGPIFSFYDNRTKYSIVAIQSRWKASSKKVYATQTTSIASHFPKIQDKPSTN